MRTQLHHRMSLSLLCKSVSLNHSLNSALSFVIPPTTGLLCHHLQSFVHSPILVTLPNSLMEKKIDNLTAMVESLTHHRAGNGDEDDAATLGMLQGEDVESEDSCPFEWSDMDDDDDDKDDNGGNDENELSDKGGDEE